MDKLYGVQRFADRVNSAYERRGIPIRKRKKGEEGAREQVN